MGYKKGQIVNVRLNTAHKDGAVHDGDTFYVINIETNAEMNDVRVYGLDAPEAPYWNGKDPHGQPMWQEAKSYLSEKLNSAATGAFALEYVSPDAYGRDIFKVWVNGQDVAKDLVRKGYGFAGDPTYGSENLKEQEYAKADGLGIWSKEAIAKYGPPKPPWQYRKEGGAGEFEKFFRFHVVDAATNAEIAQANYTLFADGKSQSQLLVGVYKYDATVKIKVTSAGYETASLDLTSQTDNTNPIEVKLSKKGTGKPAVTVEFVPVELAEGISCVLNSEPPQSQTTSGGKVVFDKTENGRVYVVSYTQQGMAAKSKQFTATDGMPPVVISLSGEDTGRTGTGDKIVGPRKSGEATPVSDEFAGFETDDNPYLNDSYEGYFTSAQARVYIGNLFLDELNTIQYALQSNMVPVYGYPDRDPAAYAQGRALVQGQLTLNYVADWYLYTALKNNGKLFDGKIEDEKFKILKAKFDAAKTNPDLNARPKLLTEAMAEVKKAPVLTVRKVSEFLREQKKSRSGYNTNPCYWPGAFDIIIEIGDGSYKSVRRIEKCKIVANEQVLDQSGQPLFDSYSFIGRRLR